MVKLGKQALKLLLSLFVTLKLVELVVDKILNRARALALLVRRGVELVVYVRCGAVFLSYLDQLQLQVLRLVIRLNRVSKVRRLNVEMVTILLLHV